MAWQKTTIEIDKRYTKSQREVIARDVIDFIVDRTKEGKNKYGNPWPGKAGNYSPSYVKSLNFRVSGKSKGKVNLKLSGDMLTDLDLISDKQGSLLIGFKNGTESNSKAEGNIKGTYGRRTPISGKKRDFLGITKKDLDDHILKKYPLAKSKSALLERAIAAAVRAKEEAEGVVGE